MNRINEGSPKDSKIITKNISKHILNKKNPPTLTSKEKILPINLPKKIIPSFSFQKESKYFSKVNEILIPSLNPEAEGYQQSILKQVVEDPTLPDYTAAYRRLSEERNKPWKINPSDIADFYLLERFLSAHSSAEEQQDDSTYLAVAKAKARISEIGKRLLIALVHDQLDEYDRFTLINPQTLPEDLKLKIHNYFCQKVLGLDGKTITPNYYKEMNFYLSDFKEFLEKPKPKENAISADDKEFFDTALRIIENQQTDRWKVMATAMRALLDKSCSTGDFLHKLMPQADPQALKKMTDEIGEEKEAFLIDRLLNYVHNAGTMSARVANYLPRSASLLVVHGLPDHADYLLYYSSFADGRDVLSTKLKNRFARTSTEDLIEDLVSLVKTATLPRDYLYAMLLEFNNPELYEAIRQKTGESLTPTSVYTLLQRISHHDGRSKGRLRKSDN